MTKNQPLFENLCVENRKKGMYLETGPSPTGRAPLRPHVSPIVPPPRPELTTGVADLTWADSLTQNWDLKYGVRASWLFKPRTENMVSCEAVVHREAGGADPQRRKEK